MKSILKNFYNKYKKDYYKDFLLVRELEYFKSSKKVLDIGCGEGNFLSMKPAKLVGVDSNRSSIAICKKRGLHATYGSALYLPFADSSFDGVHCSHLIEHFHPKEAYRVLQEATRVLKKNGIFVLSTPVMWSGFFDDFTHVKPYNPRSIERYLCDNGSEKTLKSLTYKFSKKDFYWRYRPIPLPGKIGSLLSSLLYMNNIHSFRRDAYTLVLVKL